MLINIEGISGVGKTTLAKGLHQLLSQTKETIYLGGFEITEYSSEITKFCRSLVSNKRFVRLPWVSQAHLLLSEIAYDVEETIIPALKKNKSIIFDGYFDALLAYELASYKIQNYPIHARSYFINETEELIKILCAPVPNITIYLSGNMDEINKRLIIRDNLPITDFHIQLQKQIMVEYQELYKHSKSPIIHIDISEKSKKETLEIAWTAIQKLSF